MRSASWRISGESKLVELTYPRRSGSDETPESSRYWLTEIVFSKPADVHHEKRAGIESRIVSVAIPLGPNEHKDKLFAYLPVWEGTGLPFLINADFLLVSSREGIHPDEAWNEWLRDCIAETYVKAFLSLVNAPVLPVDTKIAAYASIPLESRRDKEFLEPIVQSIKDRLASQECVLVLPDYCLVAPSESRLCDKGFRDSFRRCRSLSFLSSRRNMVGASRNRTIPEATKGYWHQTTQAI